MRQRADECFGHAVGEIFKLRVATGVDEGHDGDGFDGLGVIGGCEILNDEKLAFAVETHNIFAKLTPSHKERIVRLLKANGHVVGFMGDGINDAPALRAADIGISVDSAVDISKEAADIILLEKSLLVLEEGVLEQGVLCGRCAAPSF